MLSLNQSVSTDSNLVWVVKILGDSTTYRFTTRIGGITLSGNAYDAGVIWGGNEGVSPIRESIGMGSGGGIGQVSSFILKIARYSANTGVDGFFNEFYPATSGARLVSREVNVGFCWVGATAESEVNWFKKYYIEDYLYNPTQIELYCVEYRELEMVELPYYKVQKDFNNGVSYFTNAPEDNLSLPLPILYGIFATVDFHLTSFSLAPTVCVDKTSLRYIIATHKLNVTTSDDYLYQYLPQIFNCMILQPSNGSTVNVDTRSEVRLYAPGRVVDDTIYGQLYIQFNQLGTKSTINDIGNAADSDADTYVVVPSGETLAVKAESNIATGDLGILGKAFESEVTQVCNWASAVGTSQRNIMMNYFHPSIPGVGSGNTDGEVGYTNDLITPVNSFLFWGQYTGMKINTDLPWTIEELLSLEFTMLNSTASGDLRIHNVYLQLNNIIIAKIPVRSVRGSIRNNMGNRN